MKRILTVTVILVVALLLNSGRATADIFRDFDSINEDFSVGEVYDGTFDIITGDGDAGDSWGFDPSTQTIDNAYVMFTFLTDPSDPYFGEQVDIFWTGGVTTFSFGSGDAGPTTHTFSEDIPDTSYPALLTALSADGFLQYRVADTGFPPSPRFTLVSAKLELGTVKPFPSVPEPATMLLLGLGLMGLAGVRRFKK